jgi:SAM-dependent methyltransferase
MGGTSVERRRDEQGRGAWESPDAVEAWQRSSASRNATLAAATERMLDLAALRPGARVLDVGTGTGDQAFAAAARVGPEGHVLATDISAAMVAETAASAARAGLGHVATRVLDVAAIDLEPDRWDAVISRLGLMFTPDLAGALGGVRRVLRPGGRLAAIVWSTPERNPYMATPLAVLRAMGHPAPPETELVRAFSLGAPGVLAGELEAAGFREVLVEPVPAPRQVASVPEAIAFQRESRPLARAMAHLDEETRAAAWAEMERAYRRFETAAGVTFPGEVLVGAATK